MTREGACVSSCGTAGRLTVPSLIAIRETMEMASMESLVCKATTTIYCHLAGLEIGSANGVFKGEGFQLMMRSYRSRVIKGRGSMGSKQMT